ncbi:hypothetical protein BN1050_01489 [Metalysinibacillus saudimassiliensis]|uniref:EamA domain-containing protein n=1 Tax=Metalysinibacillus saudimassiliensis TaxID=1461583 RepID=A0A078MCW0_9BACL|nr:hypothetical protein BN1050_01489 [Metalysinibacillus saudimassiliensis]
MRFHPSLLLVLATLLWVGNFVIGRSVSAIGYVGIFASIIAFLIWNSGGVIQIGANRAGIFLNFIM